MRIDAGRLDRRMTLMQPTQSKDAMGAPTISYAEAGKRWCGRLRFDPSEIGRDGQRKAVARVDLLLRLDSLTKTIGATWRCVFDGATLEVEGVDREPHDGSVILRCKAVLS